MKFPFKIAGLAVLLLPVMAAAQNIGIGTTTPVSLLSVGENSQFQVDSSGNPVKINNVTTSFPAAQGSAGQVLTNDGAGNLSWSAPAAIPLAGDGSAGNLNVPVGTTVNLSLPTGIAFLPAGYNLSFNNITISGDLYVPSGTLLKASGNVTITGNIVVAPNNNNVNAPAAGVASSIAESYFGGQGVAAIQAAGMVRGPQAAGGGGKRIYTGSNAEGGNGGGGFTIYANGNINITTGANITANGGAGINPQTSGASIVGTGGGGGGIVVLATTGGSITVNGTIRANGGAGANGFNGNGGTGEGGGGGGGGGIIVLIAKTTPVITGALSVSGGTAGINALAQTGTTIIPGGGGGGCGGDGGNGGGTVPTTTSVTSPVAGGTGRSIQIVTPSVEAHILGR